MNPFADVIVSRLRRMFQGGDTNVTSESGMTTIYGSPEVPTDRITIDMPFVEARRLMEFLDQKGFDA